MELQAGNLRIQDGVNSQSPYFERLRTHTSPRPRAASVRAFSPQVTVKPQYMLYLRSATESRSCLLLFHSFFAESKVCQYYVSLKKTEISARPTLSREKTGFPCLSFTLHLICVLVPHYSSASPPSPSGHPIVQVQEPIEKVETLFYQKLPTTAQPQRDPALLSFATALTQSRFTEPSLPEQQQ